MKISIDGSPVFIGTGGADWQGDRPILVLLHGAGMDRTVWVLLARYFARHGYDVLAPDLPGHGASGGDALTTIDAQAEWVWSLLDQLRSGEAHDEGASGGHATNASCRLAENGESPLVCAGHSMGALAALAMAGQRPKDVSKLLLLGVGYPMVVGPPLLQAAEQNDRAAIDMITIFGHSHASRLGHNPVAGISIMNTAAALIAQCAPGVLHTDLAACNAWTGGEEAAMRFAAGRKQSAANENAPDDETSVIIAGDEDRMTPMRSTRALASLLSTRIDTIDNCGHMMMSEQPEAVLQALKRPLGV